MKELINEWLNLKERLQHYKEREMILRRKIVETVFPVYAEGTNNKEIEGYKVSFRCTMTRKLIVPNEQLEKLISDGEIPAGLFVKKYELSKTVYNKLNEKQLDIVESIIETKDNAPTLNIDSISSVENLK